MVSENVTTKETESQTSPEAVRMPAGFYRASQLLSLPKKRDLVKDTIPEGVTILYGDAGSGKTLLGLDLAWSKATGRTWLGQKVEKGRVAYIMLEDSSDIPERYQAWLEAHQLSSIPDDSFFVTFDDCDLNNPSPHQSGSWQEVTRRLEKLPHLDVLVIDTFGLATAGLDENSSSAMNLAIRRLKRMKSLLRLRGIILVHHSRKDDTSYRGSSALKAAADCMVCVQRREDAISLRCEKMRAGKPFEPIQGRMRQVGSSVVVELDQDRAERAPSLTPADRKVLEVLRKAPAPMTPAAITSATKLSGRSCRRSLGNLRLLKFVGKDGDTSNARYHIVDKGVLATPAPAKLRPNSGHGRSQTPAGQNPPLGGLAGVTEKELEAMNQELGAIEQARADSRTTQTDKPNGEPKAPQPPWWKTPHLDEVYRMQDFLRRKLGQDPPPEAVEVFLEQHVLKTKTYEPGFLTDDQLKKQAHALAAWLVVKAGLRQPVGAA